MTDPTHHQSCSMLMRSNCWRAAHDDDLFSVRFELGEIVDLHCILIWIEWKVKVIEDQWITWISSSKIVFCSHSKESILLHCNLQWSILSSIFNPKKILAHNSSSSISIPFTASHIDVDGTWNIAAVKRRRVKSNKLKLDKEFKWNVDDPFFSHSQRIPNLIISVSKQIVIFFQQLGARLFDL